MEARILSNITCPLCSGTMFPIWFGDGYLYCHADTPVHCVNVGSKFKVNMPTVTMEEVK